MKYISAHSPKWKTKKSVELLVLFEDHDTEVPFIAHEDDTDEWNRELFTRANLGDFGLTDNARRDVADKFKAIVIDKRDYLMFNGGAKVNDYWFHSDTHSKVQQLSLVIAGAALPGGIMWKTMSGEKVLMTQQLATQIYQSQMYQESMIYGYAEYLIDLIYSVDTPENLDLENGWPEVYK